MIVVTRNNGGISVKGHAGYAPHGQDIVCAAISVLAQTLVASILEMTEDEIQYDIRPGSVDIKHGALSEEALLLIESFFIGVRMIADEYSDYVRIV